MFLVYNSIEMISELMPFSERVPLRYGLIYTPKRASFDRYHIKRLGLVFAWGYTKTKH